MKHLILAATLLAPFAVAAPALAQDAAGFVETSAVSTHAPVQPREFAARLPHGGQATGMPVHREAVPSSAFPSSN
ncbi:MAG: hypothetical protein J0H01_37490 [Rhizobiales bacterium]|nr:hypothetical protein [Hyphomicrobiales bacterium]